MQALNSSQCVKVNNWSASARWAWLRVAAEAAVEMLAWAGELLLI